MKKILYPILAAAVVASACNKQEPLPGNGSDNGGVETSGPGAEMTISLKVASDGPSTKATVAGTGAENTLTSATAYVFNDVGTLETVAEFANVATTPSTTVNVTLGNKTVYVLANFVDKPEGAVPGYAETEMQRTVMQIAAINDIIGEDDARSFAMSGFAAATVAAGTGGAANNTCNVSLTRLASKVIVVNNTTDTTAERSAGRLDDISAKTMNVAKNEYYFPYPTAWSTPNYENSATDNQYISSAQGDATFTAIANKAPFFVSENKVKTPKEGNITYLLLKGTFTPKKVYNADATSHKVGVKGETFYRLKHKTNGTYDNRYFYQSPTVEHADYDIIEYTSGISYFRVYLTGDQQNANLSERYAIKRNTVINLTLTHATGAGENTENGAIPTDPETPIGETSNLTVTVTVADWTSVDQSTGVGDM